MLAQKKKKTQLRTNTKIVSVHRFSNFLAFYMLFKMKLFFQIQKNFKILKNFCVFCWKTFARSCSALMKRAPSRMKRDRKGTDRSVRQQALTMKVACNSSKKRYCEMKWDDKPVVSCSLGEISLSLALAAAAESCAFRCFCWSRRSLICRAISVRRFSMRPH